MAIDVYEGQGKIDWGKVYGSGVRRAYIKFWEGGYGLDHQALRNIYGARSAGVQIGLYYFGRPERNPHDSAHEFLWNAADYLLPGDLVPALDFEEVTSSNGGTTFGWPFLNSWKTQWFAEVDGGIGCKAAFYSYYYFWKEMTLWPDRPVWGAGSGSGFQPPQSWFMWQYGLQTIPGITTGPVDVDRVMHPDEELPVLPAQPVGNGGGT